MELADRLRVVIEGVWPFEEEDDGALTVHHDHTFASLRVVTIAEGLEMVSLTQILAWYLPLDNVIRDKVGRLAHDTVLGTVSLAEPPGASTTGAYALGTRLAAGPIWSPEESSSDTPG